ncbi:MAG: hypothetical protein ABEN55_00685, partial [Bradymonadaceae bacterium]
MTTRRKFLFGTAAGLGAVWLGLRLNDCEFRSELDPVGDISRDALPETKLDPAALLGRYFDPADPAHVGLVGLVYLQRFDGETSRIVEDLERPLRRVSEVSTLETAVERWRRDVDDDLVEMRFADVDGWQLAETTCRLCALAH